MKTRTADGETRLPFFFALVVLGAALLLAAGLRLHGLAQQVLLDDEWHALHRLMASGYLEIVRHFGQADSCIPLTLFYKALADTVGLNEVRMRALQVACGLGLVGTATWIAWRVTRDLPVTILYAFLLAAAPFLVLYSRIARPYPIVTLLAIGAVAVLWQWRTRREGRLAAAFCALTALATWFHLLYLLVPASGLLWLLAEDLRRRDRGRLKATLRLCIWSAAATLALVAPALLVDFESLTGKVAQSHPGAETLARMASLFTGGAGGALLAALLGLGAFGALRTWNADRALGSFVAWVALLPLAAVYALGGDWTFLGHTFGRYVFVVQVVLLFWIAQGAIGMARLLPWRRAPLAAALVASAAYVAWNPAVKQVATLGPWYGHIYNQLDYDPAFNYAAQQYRDAPVPSFYRRLGERPPRSVTLIEAPFNFGAPENGFAHLARVHRQRERMGLIHDLCLDGPYLGEVPRDGRFAFRNFVYLDDFYAVDGSGASYLVIHDIRRAGAPFAQLPKCLERLEALYGAPVERGEGIVVFDLEAMRRRHASARRPGAVE